MSIPIGQLWVRRSTHGLWGDRAIARAQAYSAAMYTCRCWSLSLHPIRYIENSGLALGRLFDCLADQILDELMKLVKVEVATVVKVPVNRNCISYSNDMKSGGLSMDAS